MEEGIVKDLLDDADARMRKSVESTTHEFTSVRTGLGVTAAIASRNPRVRRSVDDASTATTPVEPTTKPVLLIHQLPSS